MAASLRVAYVQIPDEYVGTGPRGADLYSCRTKTTVDTLLTAADTAAAAATRATPYPSQDACHAGFRANLLALVNTSFTPSCGGRPSGAKVMASGPALLPGGAPFPCQ
jgi:hypothetical protein